MPQEKTSVNCGCSCEPERDTPRERILRYCESRDPEIKREIAKEYQGLVVHLAKGFLGRGEPLEDLIQQGYIGLLKAIDRFDPERGVKFTTYATPTIKGEIRRYFRDKSWDLKVPSKTKERHIRVRAAKDKLMRTEGDEPTIAQIADYLSEPPGDVERAMLAHRAYNSFSLSGSLWDEEMELAEILGSNDPGYRRVLNHQDLNKALKGLPDREQRIVQLRFFSDMTQQEVGQELGISQMHVSRLERRALKTMREQMAA